MPRAHWLWRRGGFAAEGGRGRDASNAREMETEEKYALDPVVARAFPDGVTGLTVLQS